MDTFPTLWPLRAFSRVTRSHQCCTCTNYGSVSTFEFAFVFHRACFYGQCNPPFLVARCRLVRMEADRPH